MDNLRRKINKIDDQILKLLKERVDLVKKVGEYKKRDNLAIKDVKREEEVVEGLINKAKDYDLPKNLIQKIWREIFDFSYKMEK